MPPKVKFIIKAVEYYGWEQEGDMRGSHRHFTHDHKPGKVTIAGHDRDIPHEDTWRSIVRQGGLPKRIIREYSTWKYWRKR